MPYKAYRPYPSLKNFFIANVIFFSLSHCELLSILTFLNYEMNRGVVRFIVPRGISCCNFAVL